MIMEFWTNNALVCAGGLIGIGIAIGGIVVEALNREGRAEIRSEPFTPGLPRTEGRGDV